jgi:hypothetical protein
VAVDVGQLDVQRGKIADRAAQLDRDQEFADAHFGSFRLSRYAGKSGWSPHHSLLYTSGQYTSKSFTSPITGDGAFLWHSIHSTDQYAHVLHVGLSTGILLPLGCEGDGIAD